MITDPDLFTIKFVDDTALCNVCKAQDAKRRNNDRAMVKRKPNETDASKTLEMIVCLKKIHPPSSLLWLKEALANAWPRPNYSELPFRMIWHGTNTLIKSARKHLTVSTSYILVLEYACQNHPPQSEPPTSSEAFEHSHFRSAPHGNNKDSFQ